ncbi:hypothetical protein D3C83_141130 [compost metagenome]
MDDAFGSVDERHSYVGAPQILDFGLRDLDGHMPGSAGVLDVFFRFADLRPVGLQTEFGNDVAADPAREGLVLH